MDGAVLGGLRLGQEGAGPGFQRVQVAAHGVAPGVRHLASRVSLAYSFQNSSA